VVRCHFVRRTCTTVPCRRSRLLSPLVAALLSIGKLAAGAGDYYTSMVADGAEEYYTTAREAPGEWVGAAANQLGLAGTVRPDNFTAVLEHRSPGTNIRITAARSAPTVAAFDATFNAPKSVSILHGLGTPDIRAAVRLAVDPRSVSQPRCGWRGFCDRGRCVVVGDCRTRAKARELGGGDRWIDTSRRRPIRGASSG